MIITSPSILNLIPSLSAFQTFIDYYDGVEESSQSYFQIDKWRFSDSLPDLRFKNCKTAAAKKNNVLLQIKRKVIKNEIKEKKSGKIQWLHAERLKQKHFSRIFFI